MSEEVGKYIEVSVEGLHKLTSQLQFLQRQCDELQTRGSALMVERQELRRVLNLIGAYGMTNSACLGLSAEILARWARVVLKRFPT